MATAYVGHTVTISLPADDVQGISQWLIERTKDGGSNWSSVTVQLDQADENGYYKVRPSDEEDPVWVFALLHEFDELNYAVDDVVQFRATPAGYDEGLGDPVLSEEYTLSEPISAAVFANSVLNGIAVMI